MPDHREALAAADPEVFAAVVAEERRQNDGLEMIASENYTSAAVLACQGSVLTNKYAEGYPGKRYYGGCEHVDTVERLAIGRCKDLFGAEYANVQPHSGSGANMAVFRAALEPGDTVLAMDLAHGGHLTHGSHVNFSGQDYRFVPYGVDEKCQTLDMDAVRSLALEHRPKMLLAGASAYPRTLDFRAFGEIAREVGALLMVDMAHIAGLVAGKVHPSPVADADFVTSTTHKTLRGPRSGIVMAKEKWTKKINSVIFPGIQGGPLMHAVAGKAVALAEAATAGFAEYARQTVANARELAGCLADAGFRVVSGGTDNHLVLLDATSLDGLTGKIAEHALDAASITVNKNMIPYDARSPFDPSGIRIGTPALTTRGMKEGEMKRVAGWMVEVMTAAAAGRDAGLEARVAAEVREFCQDYPVPGIEPATTNA